MTDPAASALARLKQTANKSGRSFQLCLQLFCQEEFLRRLTKSKYMNNLVLKGGLLLYAITDFSSRVTVDMDFLMKRIPNTPEQARIILEEILSSSTNNDYIQMSVTRVKPISVTKKYMGIEVDVLARIKNTKTPLHIDFGVGDVIFPRKVKRKIPTQLPDFETPFVYTYSLESSIAEKLDAILTLMEYSSRMKDYYDIYFISNLFDFDGPQLIEAIEKTFSNRGHDLDFNQFKNLARLGESSEMLKKWAAFTRKINTESEPFCSLIKGIQDFLAPPVLAANQKKDFQRKWSSKERQWVPKYTESVALTLGLGEEKPEAGA